MKKLILFLTIALSLNAATVNLNVGEFYNMGNTTVMCGNTNQNNYTNNNQEEYSGNLTMQKECQYYDAREQECLFEMTKYKAGSYECKTYCQHWDEYWEKCNYVSSCDLNEKKKTMNQIECVRYDTYDDKCIETKVKKSEYK